VAASLAGTLLLTGCGASGAAAPVVRNPTANPAKADALKVPRGFDVTAGWRADTRNRTFAVAPKANVIVDVDTRSDIPKATSRSKTRTSTYVIARGAADGKPWWWSTQLVPLQDQLRPRLALVDRPDGEYVVLLRVGTIPEDGLTRARRVVIADSFAVVASGPLIAPIHHIVRDVGSTADEIPASVGDGGVVFEDETRQGLVVKGFFWDPVTGESRELTPSGPADRRCLIGDTCSMRSFPLVATAAGMLMENWQSTESNTGDTTEGGTSKSATCRSRTSPTHPCGRGFEIAGRWNSGSHAPPDRALGVPVSVTATAVVAAWWSPPEQGRDPDVLYAVHDLVTGTILAQTSCHTEQDLKTDVERPLMPGGLSPNTRYLITGPLAVDMRGTAVCFAQDEKTNAMTLLSVSDQGIAYGEITSTAQERDDKAVPRVAVLDIAAKKADELPGGASIPSAITTSGVALFATMPKARARIKYPTAVNLVPPTPAVVVAGPSPTAS